MSGTSPSSVLYSSDGYELATVNGSPIVAGTRALLISGTDPTGNSRFVPSSRSGALGITQMSDEFTVQAGVTVTASGSTLVTANHFGTQEIAIIVNVGTVTGAGSIQYTIQEVDPGDGVTVYGSSSSTVSISSGNAPGVFTAVLNVCTSPMVKVSWVVTSTFSATIYTTVVSKSTPSTQTVNGTVAVSSVSGTVAVTQSTSPWVVSGTVTANQGTPNSLSNAWPITLTDGYGNIQGSAVNPVYITGSITATNPSVGTDGAAALGFDTQVGGKVTTAAPTYTNGNLDALSLTTLGGLRIDGVYAGGTATSTATDQMVSGGYVTTAAPTYTNATLNALSLTTAGSLRVDGTGGVFNNQSVGTDAAAALGFDTQVGGKVTQAAPSYTAGNLNALSLDLFGNLRTLTDGYVTTAAPTYSNNTPDKLSLTTLGGLRIDGVYAVGTANATAADVMNSGGYVTTAAPTYTTGQLNPLSLDTAGNLRITGTVTTNKAATSAVTSVAASTSSVSLLASNATRVFASIFNDSNKTAYIKLGTTASTSSFTITLLPNSYWEVPNDYTGAIDAIWLSGVSGNARITELTP